MKGEEILNLVSWVLLSKIRKYELEGLCGHDEFPSPAAQFRNIQNQNKGKPLDLSGLSVHYAVAEDSQ